MTDFYTPFQTNPAPAVVAELVGLLDLLYTQEKNPETLLARIQTLRKILLRIDRRQGEEVERACRDLFERIGIYEDEVRNRLRALILDKTHEETKTRDEGCDDSIEWLDPLSPEEADRLLVLDEKTGKELRRLADHIAKAPDFIRQKIRPPTRLRWIGPPGVGKTTAAHWLASLMGKVLGVVRVDMLVSSWVGKSGKNIRAVFKAAEKQQAVLFLDEIDSIGVKRDAMSGASGGEVEMRRVTTALLQLLPKHPMNLAVICATNLPQLLDQALLRRLPLELRFDFPDAASRREMARRVWAELEHPATDEAFDWIARRSEEKSGSFVTDVAHAAARHAIVSGERLTEKHVGLGLAEVPALKAEETKRIKRV